jgi:transcription elongation factor GreA
MVEKHYLSKEKFEALEEELEYLKGIKRTEIASSLKHARSLGDLSENAEYHQARELQAKTEERIFQLEHMLKNAEILKKGKKDDVGVGSTVTVKQDGGDNKIFEIVDSEEADTATGRVSLDSPLGSSMRGKKKGEAFILKTPSGREIKYTILKIE